MREAGGARPGREKNVLPGGLGVELSGTDRPQEQILQTELHSRRLLLQHNVRDAERVSRAESREESAVPFPDTPAVREPRVAAAADGRGQDRHDGLRRRGRNGTAEDGRRGGERGGLRRAAGGRLERRPNLDALLAPRRSKEGRAGLVAGERGYDEGGGASRSRRRAAGAQVLVSRRAGPRPCGTVRIRRSSRQEFMHFRCIPPARLGPGGAVLRGTGRTPRQHPG